MPTIWNRRWAARNVGKPGELGEVGGRWLLAATAAALTVGCHAGNGPGPAAPGAGYSITERAESGPITALAVKAPFLWAAGVPGLRRFDVSTGEYETVGEPNDPRTRAITAIAIDDDGAAWVAGAMGIGRWVAAGDDLRYEPKGTPGTVTALAARRPIATEGLWVGGPGGLYRHDGRIFPSVDGLRDVPVSSIVLDDDGKSAWVGTHKHGLYRAEGDHATPVPGSEAIFVDAVLGVAKTAAGTRLAAGNGGGEARLYALTKAGVEGFHAAPGPVVVALVARGGDATLIAGPPGRPQTYTLRPLSPGEAWPPGSLHFSSLVRELPARWAAVPAPDRLPPDVTLAAAAGGDLPDVFVGSARMGVARAAPDAPRYVVGSQLVGEARRLYVACASAARCYVVTDGPRAWLTDGDSYQPTRLGEPEAATPLALATDAQGTTYAVAREPETNGLVITKLPPGLRAPVESDWQPLHKVALELPAQDHGDGVVRGGLGRQHVVARVARRWGRRQRQRLWRGRSGARQRARRPAPAAAREREGPRGGAAARVQPDRHRVRQGRDLLRVAVGHQPLAGRPASHLERERGAGQRVGARDRAGQRRRDLGGHVRRGGALRRPELAAGRQHGAGRPGPRHRRQGPGVGGDQQGAASPARGGGGRGRRSSRGAGGPGRGDARRRHRPPRQNLGDVHDFDRARRRKKIAQKLARSLWTGAPQK